jgi:hypothetical protein
MFSVALSLGSPPVAVNDHPALWSSDFPPASAGGHPTPFRKLKNAERIGHSAERRKKHFTAERAEDAEILIVTQTIKNLKSFSA